MEKWLLPKADFVIIYKKTPNNSVLKATTSPVFQAALSSRKGEMQGIALGFLAH